ncbi:VOC family protein [Sinomicrobium weinanense]|uniref:VOC family protein n=1 Tax=Sinomicrobium weinanense TaxID=2842200 RepID=A0A926JVI3_9FLAO|nr:VOC family protein [Sinomicrobium weinanense]MBC9798360.1 VOC family protein [Sinomicrobium weinanense]MBU3122429.1 VOC family protein [Sinomicrobium weinanense]
MKKSLLSFISFCFLLSLQLNAQETNTRVVINHIAVYVVDLAKSTHFYQDVIGLDTIPEPFHDGRHTWFTIGSNAQLHLIQGAKAANKRDKNSHLCFSVPSVPDFIKVLNKNEIAYESWQGKKQAVTTRVDGVKQIYITDPDGYWLEINDARN